jgi:hypothetical protein
MSNRALSKDQRSSAMSKSGKMSKSFRSRFICRPVFEANPLEILKRTAIHQLVLAGLIDRQAGGIVSTQRVRQ